jgi:predicted DsbA family dithiol-disulfide isomerase
MDLSTFFRRFSTSRLRIYADFIDPFCYIGFHSLRMVAEPSETALEWHGFEFNPQTPPEGMPLETAANSDLRAGMRASVRDYARRAGLDFAEPEFAPNTRLAHRLVAGLPNSGPKYPLIERLYQAYFNSQKNIGDPKILVELAGGFGISKQAAETAIQGARGDSVLARHRQEAQERRFPGLPGFEFRGKIYFGALSQDAWRQILTPKETVCTTK